MLTQPGENTVPIRRLPCPTAAGRSKNSPRPRWLSTDLRDGNQALAEPMDSAQAAVLGLAAGVRI